MGSTGNGKVVERSVEHKSYSVAMTTCRSSEGNFLFKEIYDNEKDMKKNPKKNPHRAEGKRMKRIMARSFPDFSKDKIRWLLVTATEIYYERTGFRLFSMQGILTVIRWSRKKILAAENLPLTRENYFMLETPRPTRDPRLDIEPTLFFLTPNEHWSGKGSAGKNSYSSI